MLKTICAGVAMALIGAGGAGAEPFKTHEVMDRQGFKEPLVAFTIDLPTSWSFKGEVIWSKPCSGNDHFETVMTARSPDGRTGYRIMPGHQVIWTEVNVQGLDPYLAQMVVSQMEAERSALRTKFRDSNCHVARITGNDQLFETLIRRNRPGGTQVIGAEPNTATLGQYRATFTSQPGMQVYYDARLYRLGYLLAGQPVEETLSFSWYMFQLGAGAGPPSTMTQIAVVDQMQLAWLDPSRRAADEAVLKQIVKSVKVGPKWSSSIDRFYRDLAEQRNKDQQQRTEDNRQTQERIDAQHRAFLDMLVGPAN